MSGEESSAGPFEERWKGAVYVAIDSETALSLDRLEEVLLYLGSCSLTRWYVRNLPRGERATVFVGTTRGGDRRYRGFTPAARARALELFAKKRFESALLIGAIDRDWDGQIDLHSGVTFHDKRPTVSVGFELTTPDITAPARCP